MTSTLVAALLVLSICLGVGLVASLIILGDNYRQLRRILGDAYALQRMVTTHGDAQLSADGRLNAMEKKLGKLENKHLQMQSLISDFSSIDNAESLLKNTSTSDPNLLAQKSGLTQREAELMIKLRDTYSIETVSPLESEK